MNIQALIEVFAFIGGVIGVYVTLSNKIKELDVRLSLMEKQDDRIIAKLDSIAEDVTDIKVELQNKQDR